MFEFGVFVQRRLQLHDESRMTTNKGRRKPPLVTELIDDAVFEQPLSDGSRSCDQYHQVNPSDNERTLLEAAAAASINNQAINQSINSYS